MPRALSTDRGASPPDAGFERRLARLIDALRGEAPPSVFHLYRDRDPGLDLPDGPARRLANLRAYLRAHAGARFALIGEAAGYDGCRFSGIPFTGEEQLVGESPLSWTSGRRVARSSASGPPRRERSAAIVWPALRDRADCVLWNTLPWHPHRPGEPLSNRSPTREEAAAGAPHLARFLELFPGAEPVAVGRVAEAALERLGVRARYLRHPSMGGKRAFLEGLARL
jgi:uracil-DNA glycosylase